MLYRYVRTYVACIINHTLNLREIQPHIGFDLSNLHLSFIWWQSKYTYTLTQYTWIKLFIYSVFTISRKLSSKTSDSKAISYHKGSQCVPK